MRFSTTLTILLALAAGCGKSSPRAVDSAQTSSTSNFKPSAAAATPELTLDAKAPSEENPVALGVSLDRDHAGAGDTVTLTIDCKIHADWHIYSVKGPTGVARPTRLELKLPESVTAESEWTLPTATSVMSLEGPESHYAGNVHFSVPLKIDENAAAGTVNLQCAFHYQACKDVRCLPPTSELLEISLAVTSRKDD